MTLRPHLPALLLALLSVAPVGARAQETGVPIRSNALELTLGGRLQTQLATTSVGDPASELFIRRARIEVGVRVSDRVSGVIQPDFGGGEVELKDAYLRIDATPAFGLMVGRAYRPFGLMEQTSSKRILTVERGLRIRGLSGTDAYALVSGLGYSNRDVGLQVVGAPEDAPLGLAYRAGVFRGPLHGAVGPRESYQYAGRVTLTPAEALTLGAGWSSRHFDEPVGTDLRRGHAVEVDLEWGTFAPGPHVLAELVWAETDPFADRDLFGVHVWAAWRSEPLDDAGTMLEPVFRVSHADHDPTGAPGVAPGGTLVTPGLNLYLGPLNRVMVDFDIWLGRGDAPDARSFKAMFQLAF